MNTRIKTKPKRTGSAVVELAICLPLIMTLVWGTIELSNSIYLKQTLTSAAHEGALVGTGSSATAAEINSRVNMVLNERLDTPYQITLETETGESYDTLAAGQLFSVVISANPKSFGAFIELQQVDARVTALKQ